MAKSKRDDEPTRDPAEFARECLDALEAAGGGGWAFKDVKDRPGVDGLVKADDAVRIAAVREAVERRAQVAEDYRSEQGDWSVSEALSVQNRDGYPTASLVLAKHFLRRDLPLTADDLAFLCERTACVPSVAVGSVGYLANLRKRLVAFVEKQAPSERLRTAVEQLAESLAAIVHSTQTKPARELLQVLESAPAETDAPARSTVTEERLEFAGRRLDVLAKTAGRVVSFQDVESSLVVGEILKADRETQVVVVREAIDRRARVVERLRASRGGEMEEIEAFHVQHTEDYPTAAVVLADQLMRRKLPYSDDDLTFLVDRTACVPIVSFWSAIYVRKLVKRLEEHVEGTPASESLTAALERLETALSRSSDADDRKLRARVARLVSSTGGSRVAVPLHPGEAWSDRAIADLEALDSQQRGGWARLIEHAQTASTGSPSAKWLKEAGGLLESVGAVDFAARVAEWFPLVASPRTGEIPETYRGWDPVPELVIVNPHVDALKGLAWYASLVPEASVVRALTALALTSYRKVPGQGPRMVKVGNAAVWALGAIPGLDAVGQLAVLEVKVKFRTAQKGIEKALAAAAEREGLPRDELEEMAVPAYGLEEVGRLTETFGDFTAELIVEGSKSTTLRWVKPDGKTQKSVPAVVKREFADELKELKAAAKDVQKMLPVQAERIDNQFLALRSWPYEVWRERYLDHALVGTVSRRLIWEFTKNDGERVAAVWSSDRLVDSDGIPIDEPTGSTVRLWHPIDRSVEEIVAWRDRLGRLEVRQPFKQAHREVYLLTDAERNTGVYSNRFAAHVVRQHQFHALCQARGWRNSLRLMVDDDFPPASKELPQWGLRAEFWVEGAGDEWGRDTNETGTYLHLATDQVRFYPVDAAQRTAHAYGGGYRRDWIHADTGEPVPLEEIPPLVLSEILRDVDLFVGVASVGNDPTWQDGGPDGRYRDYWESFSFGDLGESAHTRKAVLEKLVPRLKIAARCSFSDRFLVVRGDVRTYKIHLGSGNILMEPNDQYLCIVPRSDKAGDKLFLPFEGDRTLSLILSKAMMLAADTKIDDPTIVSQIA